MAWTVFLTEDAERDIDDIFRFVAAKESTARALRVLDALEGACAKLGSFPTRGNVPKELRAIGVIEYREVHWKPYRIIYRALDRQVLVYCVLDGRRDMQSLLQDRLLR